MNSPRAANEPEPTASAPLDLVGLVEINELLAGKIRAGLGELTASTDFPEPVAALLGGNVWAHDEVKDWIATHPDALLHLFSPAARPRAQPLPGPFRKESP